MESGGCGEGDIATVCGLTKRTFVFNKQGSLQGSFHTAVRRSVSGRNKHAQWTYTDVHAEGLHYWPFHGFFNSGPISETGVPISHLHTETWKHESETQIIFEQDFSHSPGTLKSSRTRRPVPSNGTWSGENLTDGCFSVFLFSFNNWTEDKMTSSLNQGQTKLLNVHLLESQGFLLTRHWRQTPENFMSLLLLRVGELLEAVAEAPPAVGGLRIISGIFYDCP